MLCYDMLNSCLYNSYNKICVILCRIGSTEYFSFYYFYFIFYNPTYHWAVHELHVSKELSMGPSTVSKAPLPLADPPRPSDSTNLQRDWNELISFLKNNLQNKTSHIPEPESLDGVPPAPMAPLNSSIFLATLEAADLRLFKPTKNSALRAFRFCGLCVTCWIN